MKRTPLILIGIAAVGIGSSVALGNVVRPPARTAPIALPAAGARAERGSDKPASSAGEAAALRAGMARLDAEMSALREQIAASQAPADDGARDVSPEPARRDPAALAQQERAWHEHMMEVDSNFQREAADPRWASSTASALESALTASDTLRGRARGIECRSRTCRVEIAEGGSGAVMKELPIFAQQFAETLPSIQFDHLDDGHGHTTMVLYMTGDDGAQSPAAERSGR
jgi:hypothetical protein